MLQEGDVLDPFPDLEPLSVSAQSMQVAHQSCVKLA